jgi:molybdenum cofactor cytidylyltransferase
MRMVSAVVLAAGESKRMGEKKELLPIAGQQMIRVVVGKLLLSERVGEIIVVLGDHADDVGRALSGVTDERLDSLIDAQAAGASIAVPVNAGRRGHPVVLDGAYRSELEELGGDAGARDILERDIASIVEVEIDDDAFLVDIDDRDDYEAVKEGLAPRE